jgi:HEAT repeat protein
MSAGFAAQALGKMGPGAKDAVPALTKALGDQNALLRLCAARALGEIGPAAKDALPKLQEMAEKDIKVRQTATEAIEKIQKAVE